MTGAECSPLGWMVHFLVLWPCLGGSVFCSSALPLVGCSNFDRPSRGSRPQTVAFPILLYVFQAWKGSSTE